MAIDLVIPVPNVDEIYGTSANRYDSIRLYRAPSRGGTYTLVTTIPLTPGDTVYPFVDGSGALSSWYKVTFYNSALALETPLDRASPFPAARDITTRKELRQKIITNLGGLVLTGASGTSTTITHSSLINTLAVAGDLYTGWTVYRPDAINSGDRQRSVISYDGTTGTITVASTGNAYDAPVQPEETVELFPFVIAFDKLNEKLNDGLEDTRFLYRLELGLTSGQLQYELPSFVEGPEYVPQLWFRRGQSGAYRWLPIDSYGRFARVRGSGFQCTLDLDPGFGENDVIALDVWRPGERLEAEDDFTQVPLPWAEAAAMVSVLDHLIDTDTLQHSRPSLYERLQARWMQRKQKMARRYGPTPGVVIQPLSRISGLPEV